MHNGKETLAYPRSYVIALLHYYALAYAVPFPYLAATAYVESGFDPFALGDFNAQQIATSAGLFMLHEGGELGSHTVFWAQNADNNCSVAVPVLAHSWHSGKGTPGQRAAAAQRPRDPAAYATQVDGFYNRIRSEGVGKACPSAKLFTPHNAPSPTTNTDPGEAVPQGITGGAFTGSSDWLLSHLGLPNIGILLRVIAGGVAVLIGVLILFHPNVSATTIAKTAGKAALL
jgi:hypothetical protein